MRRLHIILLGVVGLNLWLRRAGRYDTGGVEIRSRALHEAWLATLACAVVRLDGNLPVGERFARLEGSLDFGLDPRLTR